MGAKLDKAWCPGRSSVLRSDPIDPTATIALGGRDGEAELLLEASADGATHRVRLPAGSLHRLGNGGTVPPAQQLDQDGLLGSSAGLRLLSLALRFAGCSLQLRSRPVLTRRCFGSRSPLLCSHLGRDADDGATNVGNDEHEALAAL